MQALGDQMADSAFGFNLPDINFFADNTNTWEMWNLELWFAKNIESDLVCVEELC